MFPGPAKKPKQCALTVIPPVVQNMAELRSCIAHSQGSAAPSKDESADSFIVRSRLPAVKLCPQTACVPLGHASVAHGSRVVHESVR